MIEIALLGPPAATDSSGRELGALTSDPKRFALLGYLVISARESATLSEVLAGMFWPAVGRDAARRALRSALFQLRETIGERALVADETDALFVDPAQVTSDVAKFEAAVADGRFELATELYRGELLADTPTDSFGDEFAKWLTRERTRLRASALRAALGMVERAEQAGDIVAASYWAHQGCALSPDDEGLLQRAMALHFAAADRGGALRLYDSFARHVSIRFGTMPSAKSAALAAEIRAAPPPERAR
ncbi:MAG: BTAD domain-containing putative transcriptional regulator [Gemmatimonadota bacterium]